MLAYSQIPLRDIFLFLKIPQKIEEKTLSNSFYDSSIILLQSTAKNITRKKYRPIFLMIRDAKSSTNAN